MIPMKYAKHMGEHRIKVQGTAVKAYVIGEQDVMKMRIKKLKKVVLRAEIQVVGLDVKKVSPKDDPEARKLILYAAGGRGMINQCLIFHYRDFYTKDNTLKSGLPRAVRNFLFDERICFVSATDHTAVNGVGVKVGDLAATVLQKPSVAALNLAEIAQEVGVPYVGLPNGVSFTFELDKSNPRGAMTDEQVELVVSDAIASYRIGFQLLSSVVQPISTRICKHAQQRFSSWFR